MPEAALIESLIQSLTHLTRHLSAENEVLTRRDASALKPMQADKERLSDDYLKIMEVVRRSPGLIEGLDEDSKIRLRQAGSAFNKVMEEHCRRVTALKMVGEGVIKAITEQVAARNKPGTYGTGDAQRRRQQDAPTSIALDQSI